MDGERCGAPTRNGSGCRYPAERCPHEGHRRYRDARAAATPRAPAEALRERDLRGLGWWLIEEILSGRVTPPEASAVTRLMHTLLQLGPAPDDEERALEEVALRGLLMHGLPPRTPEEWQRAREAFDEDAIAEFLRWAPLLEGDAEHDLHQLGLGDGAGGDGDVTDVGDDEDRV